MISTIGLLAALLTTAAFLPQMLHTLATPATRGIPLRMYVIFATGVLLWLIYGLLAGVILYLKLRHG